MKITKVITTFSKGITSFIVFEGKKWYEFKPKRYVAFTLNSSSHWRNLETGQFFSEFTSPAISGAWCAAAAQRLLNECKPVTDEQSNTK